MIMNYEDPNWVEMAQAIIKPGGLHWKLSSTIKTGSLWASKATKRRCKVVWSMDLETTVEFSESHNARCTYLTERFLELYTEV